MSGYYQYLVEAWDKKTCERKAKHREVDAFGNKGMPGLIAHFSSAYFTYGYTRYNGGCTQESEWYRGVYRPFPLIHPDYEIVEKSSWGWQIRRKQGKN